MPSNDFDAIVVGAGPAGSVAAYELAKRGNKVLLVERDGFPRYKVCGGCLGNSSMSILDSMGIRQKLLEEGANTFTAVRLSAHRKQAYIQVPPGLSVSRELLDLLLVQKAEKEGATFMSKTVASLEAQEGNCCRIKLRHLNSRGSSEFVSGSLLLVANGLGDQFFRNRRACQSRPAPTSRIGLGLHLEEQNRNFSENAIQMCVARDGYVGVARVEKGGLNIAAAVDAESLKECAPGETVGRILENAGLPLDLVRSRKFKGTPQLTHSRSSVADHRIFIVGDSAGYIEPFTGEGMTWAMQSALLLAPIADRAIEQWDEGMQDRWSECYRSYLSRRHFVCRTVSRCLRNEWFTLLSIYLATLHSFSFSLAARMIHRRPMKRIMGT